jgi:hypothetical protein
LKKDLSEQIFKKISFDTDKGGFYMKKHDYSFAVSGLIIALSGLIRDRFVFWLRQGASLCGNT